MGKGVTEHVFSGSPDKHEIFRTVSHVLLQRVAALAAAQGNRPPQMLVVSNMHVVSGQKTHKIPGKNPTKRLAFKQHQVSLGIEKAVRFAERQNALAAAQGQFIDLVASGDYNLGKESCQEAVAQVKVDGDIFESLALHFVKDEDLLERQDGQHRDFIVCSRWCDVDLDRLPIAHDKQHRAVRIRMGFPIEKFEA